MKNILVVDDDQTVCLMLKSWLNKKEYIVDYALSVKDAKYKINDNYYDLILSDINFPDADGMEFLSWCKRNVPDSLVIMITGYADIQIAVQAIKGGAEDFISKPIEPELLFDKIQNALKKRIIRHDFKKMNGVFLKAPSKKYTEYYDNLKKFAQNYSHAFIFGGKGSGKSEAVNFMVERSKYNMGNILTLNLSKKDKKDLTDNYISSYLNQTKGGILVVIEPQNLDTLSQNKLIEVLKRQIDNEDYVQFVACSCKSPVEIKESIIPKLFSILEHFFIKIPELKNQDEDIKFFAEHFLKLSNDALNKNVKGFTDEVNTIFFNYNWPGNIQELKNTIIKSVLVTNDGENIEKDSLDIITKEEKLITNNLPESKVSFDKYEVEKDNILNALNLTKWNKTLAASILNIDRKTLYNKIKLYRLENNN